jgi:TonB family protein
MRNGFIVSLSVHVGLLVAVFLPVSLRTTVLPSGLVYDVSLVSLPSGIAGPPAAPSGGSDNPPDATLAAPESEKAAPKKAVEPSKDSKKAEKKKPEDKTKKENGVGKSDKPSTTSGSSQSELHSLVKGGEGTGVGGVGLPGFSSQLQLDIENFEFSYYLVAVRNKVSSNWSPPAGIATQTTRARAVVYFRILKNGRIADLKTETASGIVLFDQSALRAILRSEPFPPLPGGFPGGSLGVHFGFEYAR